MKKEESVGDEWGNVFRVVEVGEDLVLEMIAGDPDFYIRDEEDGYYHFPAKSKFKIIQQS